MTSLSQPSCIYSAWITASNGMWAPLAATLQKFAASRCQASSAEPLVDPTGPTFSHWVPTASVEVAVQNFAKKCILFAHKNSFEEIASNPNLNARFENSNML